jgi:hypothetical protein
MITKKNNNDDDELKIVLNGTKVIAMSVGSYMSTNIVVCGTQKVV